MANESTVSGQPDSSPRKSKTHWPILIMLFVIAGILGTGLAWKMGLFRKAYRVAIVTSTESEYWDRVIKGAETSARAFELELTVIRSKPDEQYQSDHIKKLMADGYDGIAVSPVNPQKQKDLLREAASKSVLVTFDSDCEDSNREVFVGTNNYFAGRQCADAIHNALPDGGEVIICVGSVDKANGRDRRQGLIDALLRRPMDPKREMDPLGAAIRSDKYIIVDTLVDGVDRTKAEAMAVDAIQKHPNLKCMVGLFGYSTPAILSALKQTNKLGQIQVVGFDEAEETLQGMESKQVAAAIVQDQFGIGFDAVRFMSDSLHGMPKSLAVVDHMQYLSCRSFTADEVAFIRDEKAKEAAGTATTQPSE